MTQTALTRFNLDVRRQLSASGGDRKHDRQFSPTLVELIGGDHHCRSPVALLVTDRFTEVDHPYLAAMDHSSTAVDAIGERGGLTGPLGLYPGPLPRIRHETSITRIELVPKGSGLIGRDRVLDDRLHPSAGDVGQRDEALMGLMTDADGRARTHAHRLHTCRLPGLLQLGLVSAHPTWWVPRRVFRSVRVVSQGLLVALARSISNFGSHMLMSSGRRIPMYPGKGSALPSRTSGPESLRDKLGIAVETIGRGLGPAAWSRGSHVAGTGRAAGSRVPHRAIRLGLTTLQR